MAQRNCDVSAMLAGAAHPIKLKVPRSSRKTVQLNAWVMRQIIPDQISVGLEPFLWEWRPQTF
jgi:hypothetical protein